MKKSLFALAAVGALAGVAHAQSSVTVYGIIDEGLTGGNTNSSLGGAAGSSTGNIKTTGLGFTSGNQSTSRIGLKGSEDLGGGMSAFFTYEFKVDNDDKSGWSTTRQAFVGVKKNGWGSIAAGTQNTPVYDAVLASDPGAVNNIAGNLVTTSAKGPQGATPVASGTSTNQPYATRLANTASIKTDNFSGFQARALILSSAGNSTQTGTNTGGQGQVKTSDTLGTTQIATTYDATNNQNGYGIGLDYTWQKLFVTANYQAFKAQSTANTISTTVLQFSPSGATTAAQNADDSNQYYAATYDFGILKAYAQYINRKIGNDVNSTEFSKYTAQQIGVNSYVTPTIQVWGSAAIGKYFAYPSTVSASGNYMPSAANLNAFQLGANYWLSKRSNLYAIYGQTATSNYSTAQGSNPVAFNQNNYSVGIRHTF